MAGADRISALPAELQVSILSCLKLRDAIRTSALARSWRHVWTLLPSLRLNPILDESTGSGSVKDYASSNWIERVHRLVSCLQGPLLHFQLAHRFTSDQSALVQSILDLLLQKGVVEMLSLVSHEPLLHLRLPSFRSLQKLRLMKCHVALPDGFQGFNRLNTLSLVDVTISNADQNLLINTCRNLNKLYLSFVRPLSLSISLPVMESLTLIIHESADKVCVVSAPFLEDAYISIGLTTDSYSQKCLRVVLGLLDSLAMLKSLRLDHYVVQVISLICW